jgi:putative ABC transport system permease protein
MIQSILKSSLRNIFKRRFYSLFSIIGLTIGFVSFILISLFIRYEKNADKHNENYDRIYRIQMLKTIDNTRWMQTPPALSLLIKDRFNEIEKQAVVFPNNEGGYINLPDGRLFRENMGLYAEQDFLSIFSFSFIYGDKDKALLDPTSMIISESLAEKYFPGENPVGKTILREKKYPFTITGVYKDLPQNSHLLPDFIVSFIAYETVEGGGNVYESWEQNAYYTYVLLKEGANYKNLDAQIEGLLKDIIKTDYRQLYLRPLSKLYIEPVDSNYLTIIYIVGLFALLVIILSFINYINLSIASGTLRAKEIGIKKASGSRRKTLISQLLIETVLIVIISAVFSVILILALLPLFNQIVGKDISPDILFQNGFILKMTFALLIGGVLAGLYPSYLTVSVNTVDLFKNKVFSKGKGNVKFRKALICFQFIVSIGLICMSVLISKQINYMLTMNAGYNKNNLLFIEMAPTNTEISLKNVQSRFISHPNIQSVSFSRGFPIQNSKFCDPIMCNWEGSDPDEYIDTYQFWGSFDFISTLELDIIKGRNFLRDFPGDTENKCIVNETFVKNAGLRDPVGKLIYNRQHEIIGVVKDFHFHDMYNKISPLVIRVSPDNYKAARARYFSFRISDENINETKKYITSVMQELFPDDPFEVKVFSNFFVEHHIFRIFNTIRYLFVFAALVAILLSIMGVVGLVNFSLNRKTKEIAIKKINGSSITSLLTSFLTEYLILIIIAGIFGTLGAVYAFQQIPLNYSATHSIWDYLKAEIIVLTVVVMSVFYKIYKESRRNPVEALRYE